MCQTVDLERGTRYPGDARRDRASPESESPRARISTWPEQQLYFRCAMRPRRGGCPTAPTPPLRGLPACITALFWDAAQFHSATTYDHFTADGSARTRLVQLFFFDI